MFENIMNFFKKASKKEGKVANNSKTAAKERLHLVLMQDRANVSADFLELMKQEIIEVIKKYIDVDESAIDVRLTNKENADGTNGAPALYANIPILNIKNEARKMESSIKKEEKKTKEEDKSKSEVKESENKENKAKETNKKDKSKEENLEVKKEEKEVKEEVNRKENSNKEEKAEKIEENKEEKTKETKKEEKLEKEEKTEKVQEKVLEQK